MTSFEQILDSLYSRTIEPSDASILIKELLLINLMDIDELYAQHIHENALNTIDELLKK